MIYLDKAPPFLNPDFDSAMVEADLTDYVTSDYYEMYVIHNEITLETALFGMQELSNRDHREDEINAYIDTN